MDASKGVRQLHFGQTDLALHATLSPPRTVRVPEAAAAPLARPLPPPHAPGQPLASNNTAWGQPPHMHERSALATVCCCRPRSSWRLTGPSSARITRSCHCQTTKCSPPSRTSSAGDTPLATMGEGRPAGAACISHGGRRGCTLRRVVLSRCSCADLHASRSRQRATRGSAPAAAVWCRRWCNVRVKGSSRLVCRYKWAEVMALDAFAAFTEAGLVSCHGTAENHSALPWSASFCMRACRSSCSFK